MSWLPGFLNPLTALIAAGISAPILLLLYFLKLRRHEMVVSSTILWRKAIQDLQVNAPFQKLRRNLLLLLQALLLLLFLLCLARPVWNKSVSAGKLAVILIDRSASMSATDIDGKSRLDEAKRQAIELVDTIEKDNSAMVIAFDDTAETVQAFTSDRARLKDVIKKIQPTDRRSRLSEAFRLAEAQSTAFIPEQNRPIGDDPTVWVFSDGRLLDAREASLHKAKMKFQRIGTPEAKNIAIVALQAKRNYEQPTEVQVFARFANYGPEPVEGIDVLLKVDGQGQRVDQKLMLLPERWGKKEIAEWELKNKDNPKPARSSVDFTMELLNAAVLRVEHLNQDQDMLPADDFAQVVVPPPRSLSVLLVTSGNYYLKRAIESMRLKNPSVVVPIAYEDLAKNPQKLAADYDAIIFDRYSPKDLPPAGNFVYFGCVPQGTALKQDEVDGTPQLLKEVGVLDWKRDHPLVKHLNLQRLYVGEMLKVPAPPTAEVIVEGTQANGTQGPMVMIYHEPRKTHTLIAFDLLQSNWPLKQSFPVFLSNLMQFLALGADMEIRQSVQPGATVTIPRLNLQQVGDPREIKLTDPLGSVKNITIPQAGDVVLPALNKVGLYTLDPPVPQFEKIAVNLLDDNESNLLPSDQAPGTESGDVEAIAGGKTRREIWWILAVLAVPLLLAEWWVYTRRVHL